MNEEHQAIDQFARRQAELTTLLADSSDALAQLGRNEKTIEAFSDTGAKLASARLKVLIVGSFKNGKSTLINALLGEEVLPAFAIPCTAVISEIKYADEKKAVVHFTNPPLDPLPAKLSERARSHILQHGEKTVPPLEISIDDIEDFIVIPEYAHDPNEPVYESPFGMIEIYWPLEICKKGIEIIDSPGLNEHESRTEITASYLGKTDVIVFVFSCSAQMNATEMQFLERIRSSTSVGRDMFFAFNRFDQVRERERERVISHAHTRLKGMTDLGTDGIFFVSALDALEGRIDDDQELFERSRFSPFEKRLADYLAYNRAKIKFLEPAKFALKEVADALGRTIPEQRNLVRLSTAEIEKHIAEIQPQLEQAETRARQVLERIAQQRERLRDEAEDKIENQLRKLTDEIAGWLADYTPKHRIKVLSMTHAKKQAEPLVRELTEVVEGKLMDAFSEWQRDELNPLLASRLEDIKTDNAAKIEQILDVLDSMRMTLSGVEATAEVKETSAWERVLSSGAGLVIGGPGSALMGATFGFKSMLVSLLPALGLVIGALILGLTNPLVLLPMLFSAGMIQGIVQGGQLNEQLKKKVGEKLAQQLREQATKMARSAADDVHESTAVLQQQIKAGLDREINSVTASAKAALEKKREEEFEVAKRLDELDEIAEQLRGTQEDLHEFVIKLAA